LHSIRCPPSILILLILVVVIMDQQQQQATQVSIERGSIQVHALPVSFKGPVVHGFGRGSKDLGCPTGMASNTNTRRCLSHIATTTHSHSEPPANIPIEPHKQVLETIPVGVYAAFASIGDDPSVYQAAMNIGWSPYYQNVEKTIVCTAIVLISHTVVDHSTIRLHVNVRRRICCTISVMTFTVPSCDWWWLRMCVQRPISHRWVWRCRSHRAMDVLRVGRLITALFLCVGASRRSDPSHQGRYPVLANDSQRTRGSTTDITPFIASKQTRRIRLKQVNNNPNNNPNNNNRSGGGDGRSGRSQHRTASTAMCISIHHRYHYRTELHCFLPSCHILAFCCTRFDWCKVTTNGRC
jgi:hypothetical protein